MADKAPDFSISIEMLGIDEVVPYENNPRFNDAAVPGVAESIRRYGFRVPLVVDDQNRIVAGHTRFKALQQLGAKKVPVVRTTGLTEEQVNEYRVMDNKLGELATWDFDKLDIELAGFSVGFDASDFGCDFGFLTEGEPVPAKEVDASVAADVKMSKCPECGHEFPK